MKLMLLIVTSLFSFSALAAFSTDNCPEVFTVNVSNISAYKSSIYKDVPGWKKANETLKSNSEDIQWNFASNYKKNGACFYIAANGETAKLFAMDLYDAEDGQEYEAIYLSIYFKIDGVRYSLLPAIDMENGFEEVSYMKDSRNQIHTPLKNSEGRWIDFEVGLGKVEVQKN